MELTGGKGVDRVVIAGGSVASFEPAVKSLKPGGKIGNVNYLGSGTYINIPRAEWGVGMGHKQINGGLTPGGRLRMESLPASSPPASWTSRRCRLTSSRAGNICPKRCSS